MTASTSSTVLPIDRLSASLIEHILLRIAPAIARSCQLRRLRHGKTVRWLWRMDDRNSHPFFEEAFRLFEHRLPPNERDESKRIEAWIKQSYYNLKHCIFEKSSHAERPLFARVEFLLVLPWDHRVLSAVYAQYYRDDRLLFLGYMAAAKRESVPEAAAQIENFTSPIARWLANRIENRCSILKRLAYRSLRFSSLLRYCQGIVFEVAGTARRTYTRESSVSPEGSKRSPHARFRRYQGLARKIGYQARIIDIPYVQPALDPRAIGVDEEPMHLGFISTKWKLGEIVPPSISTDEVTRILNFIYDKFYHHHWLWPQDQAWGYTEQEIQMFHNRLRQLKQGVLEQLSGPSVSLLSELPQTSKN